MTQADFTDYLAPPEELAARTGLSATDPALLDALRRATAEFRGQARTHISFVAGDTATLDGDGSRVLLLPHAPVRAVTSVELDGVATDSYDWTADGRLLFSHALGHGGQRVVVTYDHGFDPVPEDVAAAVLDRAESRLTIGAMAVQTVAVGGKSVTFATGERGSAAWDRVVDHYRLGRAENP
ncbi:MAG: mobile element protein [Pseudonocardiaceae bacterium]|nr:mobile element protein [Pseudonocardiaceae bacterium]